MRGVKESKRAFARVEKAVSDPKLKRVVLAGAKEIEKIAKSIVAVDRAVLKNAIETKVLPGNPAVAVVFPNYGRAPHAHLVEFGTGPRFDSNNKYVGEAPAQPFMGPAAQRGGGKALRVVGKGIGKQISNAVKGRA